MHVMNVIGIMNFYQVEQDLFFCCHDILNTFITIDVFKFFRLPFYKKNLSDEINYAKEVQETIAQLGNFRFCVHSDEPLCA